MRWTLLGLSTAFTVAISFSINLQAHSMSALTDIQDGRIGGAIEQPIVGPTSKIQPSHWSYQLIQKLSTETGLSKEEKNIVLDGKHPISRTEMAVIMSDLTDKLADTPSSNPQGDVKATVQLSEREKAQFEILQEEFTSEMKVLKARIDKVEGSVQDLAAQVKKSQDDKNATFYITNQFGPAQLYGLVQAWDTLPFNNFQTDRNFKLRRAEIGIKGEMLKNWRYQVMVDPVRSSGILKEMFVEYAGIPKHKLRFGQFKPGVTDDGTVSSSMIDTIERSQIGRIGDVREQGLAVLGDWKYITYQLGMYNGGGENLSPDDNRQLAVGAHAVIRPLIGLYDEKKFGKLELGGSLFDGNSGGYGAIKTRNRYGLEARYVHSKFAVKSEYLWYRNPTNVLAKGWYLEGLYNVTPKWQLVTRFDTLDPDGNVDRNSRTEYTAGLNYFLKEHHVRLSFNTLFYHDQTNANDGTALRFMAQQAF